MAANTITLEAAKKILYTHRQEEHTIFGVKFIKRTNGEIRHMKCRFNVKKYLHGGEKAYEPKDYNLIFVFDMDKMDYRCINLETLFWMNIGGNEYIVKG